MLNGQCSQQISASSEPGANGCHGALGTAGERARTSPGSVGARSVQDKCYDLLKHRGKDLKSLCKPLLGGTLPLYLL